MIAIECAVSNQTFSVAVVVRYFSGGWGSGGFRLIILIMIERVFCDFVEARQPIRTIRCAYL